MFITKKFLSRRTLLRGAGYAVSLPLLDAMVPAATALAATAAAPKLRMAFVYFPHGAVMNQWTPQKEGPGFDLPSIIAPLRPFQDQLTVISGMENKSAIAAPVHAITPGTWLSCVPPRISQSPFGGITVDQLAAKHIGQDTPLPSLEVSTEERGGEGACDRNYGCSYGKTISFSDPSTPLPMEHDPRKLFQRLFGEGDTADERVQLQRESRSILDMVSREASGLRKRLGLRDRAAMDDYLDTVRELERRVQRLERRDLSGVQLPDAPAGIPTRFDEHMDLMFDLIALAYQANLTRVVSFMMAAEVSNQPYNFIGVPDAFHPLSHHANNETRMATLARVQAWNTSAFAKFVARLKSLPDGEGNMLDNAILMFGSNMSDSNVHNHFPLPMAIVGGGMGRIKGNRHLRYPDKTPLANMHLTILDRIGVPMETFGDATMKFTEV